MLNSEGVHVGEVWRNPTGAEHVYTAFRPDGTQVPGGFEKKVHAVAALSKIAKGADLVKSAVASSEVVGSLVSEVAGSSAGVVTAKMPLVNKPPGMSNVSEGHLVYKGGEVKGEVWAAEHKTEKKTKFWTKQQGSTMLGKSHATFQGAVDYLTSAAPVVKNESMASESWSDVKISNEERKALRTYSSSGFQDINRTLRHEAGTSSASKTWSPMSSKEVIAARIAYIDAVMARSVIGKAELHGKMAIGPVLYRSAKLSQFGISSFADLKVGMEMQNHAYISTSKKRSAAEGFGHGMMLHIRTGPKSHGIDLKGISVHPLEHEVLLPRKSKFRVYKIESNVVHVDHIDPH